MASWREHPRLRGFVVATLACVGLLAAGCVADEYDGSVGDVGAGGPVPEDTAGGAGRQDIGCLVTDTDFVPIEGALCEFRTGSSAASRLTSGDGRAVLDTPADRVGVLTVGAPGLAPKVVGVGTNLPTWVRVVLEPAVSEEEASTPPIQGLQAQVWRPPVQVEADGEWEPMVRVDEEGIIWVSPTKDLYRSTDGGLTFEDVTPREPETVRTGQMGSDTSISIAPDGTIWWLKNWPQGLVSPVAACRSLDKAASWECNNAAIPGLPDRMAVAALGAEEAYIASTQGFLLAGWFHTTTGPMGFRPFAAGEGSVEGNLMWDEANGVLWHADEEVLLDVNHPDAAGQPRRVPTGIPPAHGQATLGVTDGVLWIRGQVVAEGRPTVVAARSEDAALSWSMWPVSVAPHSLALVSIAAGPAGHVGLMYYGSDRPGPENGNGGDWHAYAAYAVDANAEYPTWVETELAFAHGGSMCRGVACAEQSGDPEAREAGDLSGVWVDRDGQFHAAFNLDNADADYWPVHFARTVPVPVA